MSVFYIDKPDPFFRKIVSATFPEYTGRKFKLSTDIPDRLDSYWDGGTRETFVFFCLDTQRHAGVKSNHPLFERGNPNVLEVLPFRILLVKHSILRGKDAGITVYANKEDLAPLLPEATQTSEDEQIVLRFTSRLKSSYNGIKNYRLHLAKRDTGITEERWEVAKASLIASKCLNKAGAITPKGRNAITS